MQPENIIEELLVLAESAANLMRGMQFDNSIPIHAKQAMQSKINELDAAVDKYA
jgi:hypothetical protein